MFLCLFRNGFLWSVPYANRQDTEGHRTGDMLISMAIGYACIHGKLTNFDTLLTKADLNMYKDKGHSFRRRRDDW